MSMPSSAWFKASWSAIYQSRRIQGRHIGLLIRASNLRSRAFSLARRAAAQEEAGRDGVCDFWACRMLLSATLALSSPPLVLSSSPSRPSLSSPVMTRCQYKSSISSSSHLLNFLDRCGLFQSRHPYFSGKCSRYQPFACPNHHLPVDMENFFRRKWIRMTRRWRPIGIIQSFRCANEELKDRKSVV